MRVDVSEKKGLVYCGECEFFLGDKSTERCVERMILKRNYKKKWFDFEEPRIKNKDNLCKHFRRKIKKERLLKRLLHNILRKTSGLGYDGKV